MILLHDVGFFYDK